jgi:hypothetical protein
MTFIVKQDKTARPFDVSLLSPDRVMFGPQQPADAVEQFWRRRNDCVRGGHQRDFRRRRGVGKTKSLVAENCQAGCLPNIKGGNDSTRPHLWRKIAIVRRLITKSQAPKPKEYSSSKTQTNREKERLEFAIWDFFGTWSLGFGTSPK